MRKLRFSLFKGVSKGVFFSRNSHGGEERRSSDFLASLGEPDCPCSGASPSPTLRRGPSAGAPGSAGAVGLTPTTSFPLLPAERKNPDLKAFYTDKQLNIFALGPSSRAQKAESCGSRHLPVEAAGGFKAGRGRASCLGPPFYRKSFSFKNTILTNSVCQPRSSILGAPS